MAPREAGHHLQRPSGSHTFPPPLFLPPLLTLPQKGLVGRGESKDDPYKDHVSRPLNSLTDPSTFAPPPQRRGTGLAPAPAPSSAISGGEKRKVVTAPSKYQDPRGEYVEPPPKVSYDPALAPEQEHEQQQQQQQQMIEAPPEPKVYRTNTTGLSTDHLPKPPGRRDGADGRSPPSYNAATGNGARASPAPPARGPAGGAAPSLPPRLPPRGAASPQSTGETAKVGGGLLNESSVNRLGAAGVSVPGFGIGKTNNSAAQQPQQQEPQQSGVGHMNELQNRFARFNTSSSSQPQTQTQTQQQDAPATPSQGTTWAQKQAALKTASQFQKDPSKVSLSDARAAAGTANNFRQRHGEQVAAGARAANGVNQKYGVADKVGGFAGRLQGGQQQQQQQEQGQTQAPVQPAATAGAGVVSKKKPPPPPPKKKPGLAAAVASAQADEDTPPPIPMSTRPNF